MSDEVSAAVQQALLIERMKEKYDFMEEL